MLGLDVLSWLRRADATLGGRGVCPGSEDVPGLEDEAARRLRAAVEIQAATRARLRSLGRARSCAAARLVSYRRSNVEHSIVDQWYQASQIWADATLLRAASAHPRPIPVPPSASLLGRRKRAEAWDQDEARCHLQKGLVMLECLWDPEIGGFYPRCDLAGTEVSRGVHFGDDNAVAGLALIASAEVANDPSLEARYLDDARREAEFLTGRGLWDETFGGGFWWNTSRGDTDEGKSAHTNALAALFFARLHRANGDAAHRDWALRTLEWLDATLYDAERRLYRWSIHYADPARRSGAAVSGRFFNYDQSIAIEAQLLASQLDGDQSRSARARAIGETLHGAFWGEERGGYNLEAGVEQVYTSYAAWTSLGHLALFDADGDPRWLDLARANADALTAALCEPDGGYAYRHYRCVDRLAPGCESGKVPWVLDRTRDTAAQAWMQHLQTVIAERVARTDGEARLTRGDSCYVGRGPTNSSRTRRSSPPSSPSSL